MVLLWTVLPSPATSASSPPWRRMIKSPFRYIPKITLLQSRQTARWNSSERTSTTSHSSWTSIPLWRWTVIQLVVVPKPNQLPNQPSPLAPSLPAPSMWMACLHLLIVMDLGHPAPPQWQVLPIISDGTSSLLVRILNIIHNW